jgi:hypothetical protein
MSPQIPEALQNREHTLSFLFDFLYKYFRKAWNPRALRRVVTLEFEGVDAQLFKGISNRVAFPVFAHPILRRIVDRRNLSNSPLTQRFLWLLGIFLSRGSSFTSQIMHILRHTGPRLRLLVSRI